MEETGRGQRKGTHWAETDAARAGGQLAAIAGQRKEALGAICIERQDISCFSIAMKCGKI